MRSLHELLKGVAGKTIMTTVQKFQELASPATEAGKRRALPEPFPTPPSSYHEDQLPNSESEKRQRDRRLDPEIVGFIGRVMAMDLSASSVLTQARLGWQPRERGLLEDLEKGTYFV